MCEGVTTNTPQKHNAYKSWRLSQMFSGYYICKIMVVVFDTSSCDPSSVVTNCKILVVRYGLGRFLSGYLIQLAIDNLTN